MKESEPQFRSNPVHYDRLGTFCFLGDQCGEFLDDKITLFAFLDASDVVQLAFIWQKLLLYLHAVSYTHLRAHETLLDIVFRLLLARIRETSRRLSRATDSGPISDLSKYEAVIGPEVTAKLMTQDNKLCS